MDPLPMATAAPSWSELPTDVLSAVFLRLRSLAEHARCSTVCKHWRLAALECPLPRLLMPSTAGTPAFFRIVDETTHRLTGFPNYARRGRFCGSFPGGWLAVALDQWSKHLLFNIRTLRRFILPDAIRIPFDAVNHHVGIYAIALSAAPTTHGDAAYLAAAITYGVSSIAFWRPGMDCWSPPRPAAPTAEELRSWHLMLPQGPVEDLLYFKGQLQEGFYILNADEDLAAYVPENGVGGPLGVRLVRYIFPAKAKDTACPGEIVVARYLVESRGQLLMVKRYLRYADPQRQTTFDVFALEGEQAIDPDCVAASWRRCTILTGRLFFLGRGCSRALETGESGPSWIYFVDDAIGFYDAKTIYNWEGLYRCRDTGKLRHLSQEVHRFLPEAGPADCSPWIWLFR